MDRRVCLYAVLLCGTVLLAGCTHRVQTQSAGPQLIALDIRTDENGVAWLYAYSPSSFTFDPAKLSFVVRPHSDPTAEEQALTTTFGHAEAVGRQGPPTYRVPITFNEPANGPGMYDVDVHAAEGFAYSPDGRSTALGDAGRGSWRWHDLVWWPNERDGDAARAEIQAQIAGKTVHGYGGISINTPPYTVRGYPASTGIHVRSVERDTGKAYRLWTGSNTRWGYDPALSFIATSPLRIVVEVPVARTMFYGGGSTRSPDRDPNFRLADWQVDVSVSAVAPKSFPPDHAIRRLHKGMSRVDVAWLVGYPNELGDRATLDRKSVWHFDPDPPVGGFTVTFKHDRVVAFTLPAMPP